MRVLLFLILITLILSCSEQSLIYEPQTRVQQGVPSGQIGPQIDTLFSSWKEFANDPYSGNMSILNRYYKNQMDNGLFGLPMGIPTFFGNVTKDTYKWAPYKTITLSFTFVTTGVFDEFVFWTTCWHIENPQHWDQITNTAWIRSDPNDSSRVSYTIHLDSLWTSYKDLDYIDITYYSFGNPIMEPNLKYSAYVSELLVTAERRQDASN